MQKTLLVQRNYLSVVFTFRETAVCLRWLLQQYSRPGCSYLYLSHYKYRVTASTYMPL